MTNEIKELLFLLHNDRLTESGKRKLEDYITNLQEEKQRLLESADCLSKGYNDLEKRIDKAIYNIQSVWHKGINRYGEKTHFVEYVLIKDFKELI